MRDPIYKYIYHKMKESKLDVNVMSKHGFIYISIYVSETQPLHYPRMTWSFSDALSVLAGCPNPENQSSRGRGHRGQKGKERVNI